MNARLRSRVGSLRVRVATLLGLALLPLAMIAVYQSILSASEARRISATALLGQTERASAEERAVMQRALGAAGALGSIIAPVLDKREICSARLRDFVERAPDYVFAGFIDRAGQMDCASSGPPMDFSDYPSFRRQIVDPRPLIEVSPEGAVTGAPVIIASAPVRDQAGTLLGFLAISVSRTALRATLIESSPSRRDFAIAFFDRTGALFASNDPRGDGRAVLPRDADLTRHVGQPETTFMAVNADGERRQFAVMPIVAQDIYALASWRSANGGGASLLSQLTSGLVPILMAVIGLTVAYISVNQLVIRPINHLRIRMARFVRGDRGPQGATLPAAPRELRELAVSFDQLARTVTRDEIERDEALSEKTILLREVYHRVKNNLQLIVSILNLQIRNAVTEREKMLLRRLQDRVMSLATVHKSLYTASSFSSVRADGLFAELVSQLVGVGAEHPAKLDVRTDFDPVTLHPDQAVPLALLLTEAGTNALKHTGARNGETWVSFTLKRAGPDTVTLKIANSKSDIAEEPDGAGLGSRLIDAFVSQLDGEMERIETDGTYTLHLTFKLLEAADLTDDAAPILGAPAEKEPV
ncbi:MAG: sensor histidine kinase [Pseudomonadota bacterium]